MLATGDRFEKFNLNFPLNVVLAEVGSAHLHLVPLESPGFRPLDLRLVDRSEFALRDVSEDDEEATATFGQSSLRVEEGHLRVGSRHLLLSGNYDPT